MSRDGVIVTTIILALLRKVASSTYGRSIFVYSEIATLGTSFRHVPLQSRDMLVTSMTLYNRVYFVSVLGILDTGWNDTSFVRSISVRIFYVLRILLFQECITSASDHVDKLYVTTVFVSSSVLSLIHI